MSIHISQFSQYSQCSQCLQLADALIKQDAPSSTAIAVVPMGTANDFATGAGIPEDPWEALQLAVHETAYPVDVGLCNEQVQLPPMSR